MAKKCNLYAINDIILSVKVNAVLVPLPSFSTGYPYHLIGFSDFSVYIIVYQKQPSGNDHATWIRAKYLMRFLRGLVTS